MYKLLLDIFWIVFIIRIWFYTDAYTQYFKFTKRVKLWNSYKEEINHDISFLDYNYIKNPNFFNKLISCESCLLFWISLFFSLKLLPILYINSYIILRIIKKL